jgi:uncharacterized LabA/DUF88 family protein
MKRVLTLIDESNLAVSAREAGVNDIDYKSLTMFLVRRLPDREPLETVVYVGMPPNMDEFAEQREHRERFVHTLRMDGFMVVTNEGGPTEPGHYSANVDVMMALDAMDLAYSMHPQVIVLVSGDADFSYLCTKLRDHGIRVEVAAAADSVGRHLKEAANEVVDLSPLFEAVAEGRKPKRRQMVGFTMGDGRNEGPDTPAKE